jgi:hypothetical protein
MALAKGRSTIKIGPMEMHTKTSIHFAELLTGVIFYFCLCLFKKFYFNLFFLLQAKFTIAPTPQDQMEIDTEESLIITCDGIGFHYPHLKG